MNSKRNNARALKGFLKYSMISNRSMLKIFSLILFGIILLGYVIGLIFLKFNPNGSLNSESGALTGGFVAAAITLMIAAFVTTSKAEMNKVFTFPVNRNIFAAGNIIIHVLGTLVFTAVVAVTGIVEIFISKLVALLNSNFIFINEINLENFTVGFWVSWSYLIFFVALSYCIGMYFFRNKIAVSVVLGIILIFMIAFPWFGSLIYKSMMFFFGEPSILLLSVKLWTASLVLHLFALIPLKIMEVKI